MKLILKIGLCVTVSLIILSSKAVAEAPIIPIPTTIPEKIVYYANLNGIKSDTLLRVAKCESGYRNDGIYGDSGKAYGVYQYHYPTFQKFSKLMGEELNYKSANDQIKLTAYIFAHYPKLASHWTCK